MATSLVGPFRVESALSAAPVPRPRNRPGPVESDRFRQRGRLGRYSGEG